LITSLIAHYSEWNTSAAMRSLNAAGTTSGEIWSLSLADEARAHE
jgi:hypothetical protein